MTLSISVLSTGIQGVGQTWHYFMCLQVLIFMGGGIAAFVGDIFQNVGCFNTRLISFFFLYKDVKKVKPDVFYILWLFIFPEIFLCTL